MALKLMRIGFLYVRRSIVTLTSIPSGIKNFLCSLSANILLETFSFVSATRKTRMSFTFRFTMKYQVLSIFMGLERFSYDLEMKTREQNRNNKRTEIERFDWCIERIQTHLAFGWLSERSGKQTSCPKNFLEIALTSYCNTIGQSNNAFPY